MSKAPKRRTPSQRNVWAETSILIDATALQSEHRLRGVGAYLRHLIHAVEDLGEVRPWYIVSSIGREHVMGLLPQDRTLSILRPHRPAQVYWAYNEIALRRALFAKRPNVFFAPDFNGLIGNPAGTTVAVLHDLTALKLRRDRGDMTPGNLSERLSDLRWRVYERKLRSADRILTISHSAKCDAVDLLGIPEERMTVVHHGLDHDKFKSSRGSGAFAQSPPYLLNLGARSENKNQARLLEAFARIAADHQRLELWFAGPWRAEDLAWLARESLRLGVGNRVKHVGYVPDADLPGLYGNARAFVFPSLEEGFGLPVLEAMACGAPVITSDRSSLPEVAGNAALLVDPTSVEMMVSTMDGLLADEGQWFRLRELGYDWARDFSWVRTARETSELLLRAAAAN